MLDEYVGEWVNHFWVLKKREEGDKEVEEI